MKSFCRNCGRVLEEGEVCSCTTQGEATPNEAVATPIENAMPQQDNSNIAQQNIPQQNIPQQNIPQQNIPQQNIPQQNIPQQNIPQPYPQNMGQPYQQNMGQPYPQNMGQPYPQNMGQQPYPQNMGGQPYQQNMGQQPYQQNMGQPYQQNMGQQPYPQNMGQPYPQNNKPHFNPAQLGQQFQNAMPNGFNPSQIAGNLQSQGNTKGIVALILAVVGLGVIGGANAVVGLILYLVAFVISVLHIKNQHKAFAGQMSLVQYFKYSLMSPSDKPFLQDRIFAIIAVILPLVLIFTYYCYVMQLADNAYSRVTDAFSSFEY